MSKDWRMGEQIGSLISLAESTVARIESIAELRFAEGRNLSEDRRMDLERLQHLLARIERLLNNEKEVTVCIRE